MEETEPSSDTWTSRTTLPERWSARASGGYRGSVRRSRRACAGESQTLWGGAVFAGTIFVVDAVFVDSIFVDATLAGVILAGAILVVENASTMESLSRELLSCLVGSVFAWRLFAESGWVEGDFMRKMTLPFS